MPRIDYRVCVCERVGLKRLRSHSSQRVSQMRTRLIFNEFEPHLVNLVVATFESFVRSNAHCMSCVAASAMLLALCKFYFTCFLALHVRLHSLLSSRFADLHIALHATRRRAIHAIYCAS